jgi:hypothetical protein
MLSWSVARLFGVGRREFVGCTKRKLPIDKTTNKRRDWPVVKDAERAGGLEEEKRSEEEIDGFEKTFMTNG